MEWRPGEAWPSQAKRIFNVMAQAAGRREAAIRTLACPPTIAGSAAAATTSAELRASKNEQAEPLRKSFELPARTSADPDPEEPRAARFV